MEQKFRVRLIARISSSISAIVFIFIAISLFSQFTKVGPFRKCEDLFRLFMSDAVWVFLDNPAYTIVIMLIATGSLIYMAIGANLNQYTIGDNGFTVKEFLKGERHYELSEIDRIAEKNYRLFAYLEISVRDKKKPIMLGIDKIDKFVEILLTLQSKTRDVTFDEKHKIVNFS